MRDTFAKSTNIGLRGLIVYLLCDLYPIVRAQNFLVTVKKPGIELDIIEQLLYVRSIQERRFEGAFPIIIHKYDLLSDFQQSNLT